VKTKGKGTDIYRKRGRDIGTRRYSDSGPLAEARVRIEEIFNLGNILSTCYLAYEQQGTEKQQQGIA
jgi:hypothetical protein